jgi:hypothetical protein
LPSIHTLKQEWATLEAERKTLYRDYHELKEQHRQLFTARGNIERLFGLHRDAPARATERRQISRER